MAQELTDMNVVLKTFMSFKSICQHTRNSMLSPARVWVFSGCDPSQYAVTPTVPDSRAVPRRSPNCYFSSDYRHLCADPHRFIARRACPQRAEYLAPICPTSPPGTKPPGNDAQRVPRRCVRAPPAKARAPGSPPTSPMMSLGLHPPGHRPLHGDHRPATPTLPIGWTRPTLRSPVAT